MLSIFITVRFLDVLDILLVAFLLYEMYMMIKDTVAMNIFVGIFSIYLMWLIVKALNMQLLSTILGAFIGGGIIALIIVFQQEIRRFLLFIGTTENLNKKFSLNKLFTLQFQKTSDQSLNSIVTACEDMSEDKVGALIVLSTKSELKTFYETGDIINADVSTNLIENIFFKNSPLHDGAVIIINNKIKAARCVLPINDSLKLSSRLGLRHRAALSLTNETDAVVVVVSEETGNISFAKGNKLKTKLTPNKLLKILTDEFRID
ncbi:MAG: TIGR00159 family protein [Bacteroidetes bacterium]|nr:TIGR00159 family protein [Bacteroidota bacterium]